MIRHIQCDIFESGADIICHQVNCQGVMGGGVALQVREKFPTVYESYITLCGKKTSPELLGIAQNVQVDPTLTIVNVFSQDDFGYDGNCYTNYDALKKALQVVYNSNNNKVIAIPYLMGCYRGGGDWNIVYSIIEEIAKDDKNDILICEYNKG